jgi:type II secretory ATPase GspE/PulE/Tfp pilus assembly ATPase PilB-like protein
MRRVLERSTEEISASALEQGMRTLRADGTRLVVAGVTSVDEIRRVVG